MGVFTFSAGHQAAQGGGGRTGAPDVGGARGAGARDEGEEGGGGAA